MSISQREAACVRVSAAGAITSNNGFNTPVHVGAGSYTIKTDRTWDFANCKISAQVFGGAANANIQVTTGDGLNWTVITQVGAGAADEAWDLLIEPFFT